MEVKIIKASKPLTKEIVKEESAKLRVAAYCRVSTDMKEQQSSYKAQCNHYSNYIKANSEWELAGIFADDGISGTSIKGRTQFNDMIEACEDGKIDMVITKSISRFARNTLDCLTYIRKLKALGIPIYFEKENINTLDAKGEILLTIMASIAQQESMSISQNVRMGIQYGFKQGKVRLDYTRFLGLTKKNGKLIIVPDEADTVRRIYREYLEGYSPETIARHLTAEKIKGPTGALKWYASTIASILSNEKYCGDAILQKYYVEDYLTHRLVKNTAEFPQYYVENNHAPIVPKQVFFQVQGEKMRRASLRNDPSKFRCGATIALSRKLICSKCGRTLKRITKQDGREPDWRCRRRANHQNESQRERNSSCGCRVVPDSQAKDAVLQAFNRLPEYLPFLVQMRAQISEGDIKRVDALIDVSKASERRMKARLGELDEICTEERTYIESEIEQLQTDRNNLLLERAKHNNNELQIRLLLELIGEIDAQAERFRKMVRTPSDLLRSAQLSNMSSCCNTSSIDAPACYHYDDFFSRTHVPLPDEMFDVTGKLVLYDDALVAKYIDHLTVIDEGFDVRFSAGVTVRVKTSRLKDLKK